MTKKDLLKAVAKFYAKGNANLLKGRFLSMTGVNLIYNVYKVNEGVKTYKNLKNSVDEMTQDIRNWAESFNHDDTVIDIEV